MVVPIYSVRCRIFNGSSEDNGARRNLDVRQAPATYDSAYLQAGIVHLAHLSSHHLAEP